MVNGLEGVHAGDSQNVFARKTNRIEPRLGRSRDGMQEEELTGVGRESAKGQRVDKKTLAIAVDSLKQTAMIFNKGLDFSIHEETERLIVRVIDKETNEVIREIPPEKILDIVAQVDKLLGLIIDERV